MILRGFCTYAKRDQGGRIDRAKEHYYKWVPNHWEVETQSDMLWLTAAEWQALVPKQPHAGKQFEVASAIQRRFFSTIGIEYMQGSVRSLPPRQTTMTLTVLHATADEIAMRLDGYGSLGAAFVQGEPGPSGPGCEVRVLGQIVFDVERQAFDRFDVVGVGEAWKDPTQQMSQGIRLDRFPWMYGIAIELVKTRAPIDETPPYNLLHYGRATGPYFEKGQESR